MATSMKVKATKPTPAHKKSIKVNFRDFFKAAGKGGVNLLAGKWDTAAGSAVDMLSALNLKSGEDELAWALIYRATLRAIASLIGDTLQLEIDEADKRAMHDQIAAALSAGSVVVDLAFLKQPAQSPLVSAVAECVADWGRQQGFKAADAVAIAGRLRGYFALALHEEWTSSPNEYSAILKALDSPFAAAAERDFGWIRYSAFLQKQVCQPMFLETFGLQQVFIRPRAYYETKARSQGGERDFHSEGKRLRIVVDLASELIKWIDVGDKNDAVRLLSGGPGSGKSSFTKMFAAEVSAEKNLPVLLIPMHHFDPSDDLIDAVGRFVRIQNILPSNPLGWSEGEERVLVIFDGLDELALQGKVGERAAQEFVREILRKVDQLNQRKLRLQIVVSGRELVIQSTETFFRRDGQVLHVLPYFVQEDEDGDGTWKYSDPEGRLQVDQRDEWWRRYGAVIGEPISGLPSGLDKGNLTDITAQPLLNYLVALALRRGQLELSASTNLNAIYADLLRAIYERGWSTGTHAAIKGIDEQDFYRILEEVALASWHGNGRTTTVKDIESHCASSGMHVLLEKFARGIEEDPKSKVTQLLTAFYFRQSGQDAKGERTFEFTHKSFGEYLISRRIVRELRLIHRKLVARDADPDDGWDMREALMRWLQLTGSASIDEYLFSFLVGEVEFSKAEASNWQDCLIRMLESCLRQSFPIERLSPRPSFGVERSLIRNAEEGLLVTLNACARSTGRRSNVGWPNSQSLGEMLCRLIGQGFFDLNISKKCLSHLSMDESVLVSRDLWQGDLQFSSLRNANLVGADCRYANFSGADLRGATMVFGNFGSANFSGALLGGAAQDECVDFGTPANEGAPVPEPRCHLAGANFTNAELANVRFEGLDLRRVNFSDAKMKGTNFRGATISSAQRTLFRALGAKVVGANVEDLQKSKDRQPRRLRIRPVPSEK